VVRRSKDVGAPPPHDDENITVAKGAVMKVSELIQKRQAQLVFCHRRDTVQTAARLLQMHDIGALPVLESGGRLVGILSERDIARYIASPDQRVNELIVDELMTYAVVTCSAEDSVHEVAILMDRRRVRHLPVMDGNKAVAMISQRDVSRGLLEQYQLEVAVLRDYTIALRQ
jgi:CBS domain-containing protein